MHFPSCEASLLARKHLQKTFVHKLITPLEGSLEASQGIIINVFDKGLVPSDVSISLDLYLYLTLAGPTSSA